MKCLKIGFSFRTVVSENRPVGYVRFGFRIFVMMDVARSSESSMLLHALPWHGVGPLGASEARRRWF